MSLTAVSLFAGVGGFDEAMRRNGIDVVATVEIDKAARGVLRYQFPHATHFEDVTEVTGEQLRDAGFIPERGIITGGFPCQDLSVAGKRAGLVGRRSGLFWEIVRLVDELHPRFLVLENVPGLLSSNGGRDFGAVLGALGDSGYGIAYRILDSQWHGLAQRRKRVFIVGCLGDDGRTPSEILAISQSLRGDSAPSRAKGQETAPTLTRGFGSRGVDMDQIAGGAVALGQGVAASLGTKVRKDLDNETYVKIIRSGARDEDGNLPPEVWAERDVAPTLNAMDNTGDSRATVLANTETAVRRLSPIETERLQGFPDNWTKYRLDKGEVVEQSDSNRYRQMGNAVSVPVVEWIMKRLTEGYVK